MQHKTIHARKKLIKLDFTTIKNFCSAKDSIKKMRREVKNWGKIYAKNTSEKGVHIYKIYKSTLKMYVRNS